MARAYEYAEGGPMPMEIQEGQLFNRFGGQAVYGRQMGFGEMQRILIAETIVSAYRARAGSLNWVTWAKENPELDMLLKKAERLCYDQ